MTDMSSTSISTQLSPVIERSKQELLLLALPMMKRSVEAALRSLEETERRSRSVTRRLLFADARAALESQATILRQDFPGRLMSAVGEALQQDGAPTVDAEESSSQAMLSLLEDADVARFVEASRLQQVALQIVEQPLAELDSLISSALGFPVVHPELNPFRPEILCRVLLEQLCALPRSDEFVSQWVAGIARPFAEEMNRLYQLLVALLAAQGVEEARYRLRLSPSAADAALASPKPESRARAPGSARPGAGAASGDTSRLGQQQPAVPSMEDLSRAKVEIHPSVMAEFLYRPDWNEAHDQPLSGEYYEGVSAVIRELDEQQGPIEETGEREQTQQQRQRQGVMERAPGVLSVDTELPSEAWNELASAQARTRALMRLKAGATLMSQVLGLDAVRLLINQVADDRRILLPLREAFVALEPALLRTALAEPRFFGDAQHPARVLIESVAQRGFRYNDEFAPEFEDFMRPVRAAVRMLESLPQPEAQDYLEQLEGLKQVWDTQDAGEGRARDQAVGSMAFAQDRQALANRISRDFDLRSDLEGVPPIVVDFLHRDWALVIAHAQLTQTTRTLDPGGYLAVVSDLLWSVNRKRAVREPARLFEIVPGLLATLQRGLDMLGKEPRENEAFFDALLRLHNPVLRLRRMRIARDAKKVGREASNPASQSTPSVLSESPTLQPNEPMGALDAPRERTQTSQPWLGRHELETFGFEDSDGASLHEELHSITPEMLSNVPSNSILGEFVSTQPGVLEPRSNPAPDAAPEPAPPSSEPPALIEQFVQAPQEPDQAAAEQPGGLSNLADLPPDLEEQLLSRVTAEVARLRAGDWVDLQVQDRWRRAQLSWTSNNGSLFMFVSEGGRPHGMTRRSCERLMLRGQLIPVDIDPVIERALRRLSQDEGADTAS